MFSFIICFGNASEKLQLKKNLTLILKNLLRLRKGRVMQIIIKTEHEFKNRWKLVLRAFHAQRKSLPLSEEKSNHSLTTASSFGFLHMVKQCACLTYVRDSQSLESLTVIMSSELAHYLVTKHYFVSKLHLFFVFFWGGGITKKGQFMTSTSTV